MIKGEMFSGRNHMIGQTEGRYENRVQIGLQTTSSEDNPNSSTGPGTVTHNTVKLCCIYDHSKHGAELRSPETVVRSKPALDQACSPFPYPIPSTVEQCGTS